QVAAQAAREAAVHAAAPAAREAAGQAAATGPGKVKVGKIPERIRTINIPGKVKAAMDQVAAQAAREAA
ncbi:hypothetical protein, partial [Bacillus sp. MUM 116]|uniref:hypothetical protein n=1 Tax=Bacillus sp. MUM 116 TaxID=1678002 RepID=UPI0015A51917